MLFDVKPTYVITRTHTLSPHDSTSKRVGREFNRDRLWGVNTHGHLQCWWFTDFIFETSSANLLSRAHHYKRRLSLVWGALIWAERVRSHVFRMGLSSKAKDGCSQRQHLNLQSNSKLLFSPVLSNGGKLGGNQEKNQLTCLSGRFIWV